MFIYLNPIKYCAPLIFAPLIFAQLIDSYICAWIIFAHWKNLYFCIGLSYDWKCSARHYMKYDEIQAFSNPYFPVYRQNCIHKVMIKNASFFVPIVLCFRTCQWKKIYTKKLMLKSSTQWYHMTECDVI